MSFVIVNQGDKPNSPLLAEFMIDSQSDLQYLPTDVPPGSIAATADLMTVYRLNISGEWVKVGGE